MLKKTITYKDYNDVERTEDFYFNLTKAEVLEMEMSVPGGLAEHVSKIFETQDHVALAELVKSLILKAYGEKSPEGKRFAKSPTITAAFSQTEAYSQLYIELATDTKAAEEFINGIVPTMEIDD